MAVALVKRQDDQTLAALRKAIEACGGFEGLKPGTKIILKPNMVMRGFAPDQLPNGMVTLAETMESMIILLREHGYNDITIADGSVIHPELKLNTNTAYRWAGYNELSQRLNVPLIDLNEGPFETVYMEGFPIKIAKLITEAEFLINMPVLKTHNQTKVSLGLKNLKGVIAYESKKDCHRHDLMRSIALLGRAVKVDLTVLDGTYGLQKGPTSADHHRMDIFVAGKDILEVDIVGSWLLGYNPAEIEHLRIYAELAERSLSLEKIEIIGEEINNLAKPLDWNATWTKDLITLYKIKGISIEPPDPTCCSGCSFGIVATLFKFFQQNVGKDFGNMALVMGKQKVTDPSVRKVIALGKCACETNGSHPNIVKVPGCPAGVKHMTECLKVVADEII
ncbi:MAG: DUF362 domain-containing protein [Desulfitobacteriaceae bacterium]|nr:DUF362 domain-containing protein [Desulfitobacteriaceae bacterium]MDD4345548.1 DUF362 domain-containing protein [Desulfitobacteriaceae bacterium]MDD4401211.1 DUF362 domain-containing protein [Desulfitobacteriaceae bacterium]